MFCYKKLTRDELVSFKELTFPLYREQILHQAEENWITIGATFQKKPIGLAIASREGVIYSLFVEENYRNQGVGNFLLQTLEKKLRAIGCTSMGVTYLTKRPSYIFLEKILTRLHWADAKTEMVFYEYDTLSLNSCPFADVPAFSSAFSLFSFEEISASEKNFIKENKGILYPQELDPFAEEDKIECLNSLALRYHDQFMGWIVTHRIAFDTIRYTSLFVKKQFRYKGCAIALLAESVKRQFAVRELAPRAIHGTYANSIEMLRLAQKKLLPYAQLHYTSKVSKKQLK